MRRLLLGIWISESAWVDGVVDLDCGANKRCDRQRDDPSLGLGVLPIKIIDVALKQDVIESDAANHIPMLN